MGLLEKKWAVLGMYKQRLQGCRYQARGKKFLSWRV
jgi:hypothetical protein